MNPTSDLKRDHDVHLWWRVLADDTTAFEEVVAKFQNLIASVAYSATGNFSLSEEVTQETFWQAWRQRFQLREPARLGPWLCGIARNLAVQTSKKENRQQTGNTFEEPGSSRNDPALNSISAEERQLVWETLEEIPDTYREALVLFYREEQSMAEVALALDVSVDVAKQRVHRGRELLRATLANRVEDVLVRTRPGRLLTTRVMVGLAALSASLKATSTASAATATTATVGTATATTLKSAAMAGAATGISGGLLGAVGGLGGAFLGCWLPAQMVETLAERKLLEKHGRRSFATAIVFTAAMLLLIPLVFVANGLAWYFGMVGLITLIFLICIVYLGMAAQAELTQLQSNLPIGEEVNPSALRRTMGLDKVVYRGRRHTSHWRLLGIPLIDIQFNDAFGAGGSSNNKPLQAFGWIAVGDRATGVLFAAGGIAKGLVAVGGLAVGGIAVGGCSLGGLAIGGCALGWLAFGGAAFGYEAVGGLAVAWHVATGGAAIAYHLAVGGGAWAHDYAVGGGAWASEVNTDAAKELAKTKSKIWMMEWVTKNQFLFLAITLTISLLPAALLRFAYRRESR